MKELIPISDDVITDKIFIIRGVKVMLDSDLAALYGVETGRLNEQVKRNIDRFPPDFMFQCEKSEWDNLKSQNAISSWGGRRKNPLLFTEHGVLMLSSILKSKRAITVNIQIMRIFTKMRETLFSNAELLQKFIHLESKVSKHDEDVQLIFTYLKELLEPSVEPRNPIGYRFKKC